MRWGLRRTGFLSPSMTSWKELSHETSHDVCWRSAACRRRLPRDPRQTVRLLEWFERVEKTFTNKKHSPTHL